MRLRPSNEPTLKPLIHLLNGYSGGTLGSIQPMHQTPCICYFHIHAGKTEKRLPDTILLTYGCWLPYAGFTLGVHILVMSLQAHPRCPHRAGMGKLLLAHSKIEKKRERQKE